MIAPNFQVFECTNPECRMRFSNDLSTSVIESCPKCKSLMEVIGEPYSNYQREFSEIETILDVTIILDNLRSTSNVGSIFRSANAVGINHIYCCGTTPTPDHNKIQKASLGSEQFTSWEWCTNSLQTSKALQEKGNSIVAIEYTHVSKSIFQLLTVERLSKPLTLVFGNEISGIDPGILSIAEEHAHIPMQGIKSSLNVAVAVGIVLYTVKYHLSISSTLNSVFE